MKNIKWRICSFLVFMAALVVLVEGRTLSTDRAFALTPANVPCGLVGWWPLDGNATDIKNGNNGIVVNGGAFVSAMVNKGWKSNGQTSVVKVPDAPALHVTKFTIDFWVKLAAYNQGNTVAIWKGNAHGQDGTSAYGVLIRGISAPNPSLPSAPAGTIIVEIGNQSSAQFMQSTSALPLKQFKHVTVTADGSYLRLYIDGSPDGMPVPQTLIPVDNFRPLQIGGVANSFYNNTSLNGVIDEVELFNRALDPNPKSEISAIFQAGNLGKCKT
ncbi:MAG TPA: LamG domain-containing protein [Candidatus Elarobacter sp.]